MRRWRLLPVIPAIPPMAADALLALAAATAVYAAAAWERALWGLTGASGGVTAPPVPGGLGAGTPLVLAAFSVGVAAPLALRRRFPVSVALISVAAALLGTSVPGWSGQLVAAVALCSAAYHRPRQASVLLILSVASALTPTLFATPLPGGPWPPAFPARVSPTPLAQGVLIAVAPVAVGYALHLYRERARQQVLLHQAQAARVVAEERAWIAREIHDAVGHHLTAIRMQANAARHVLPDAPPPAARALGTVADLSASALRDVRLLLAALRDEHRPTGATLADVPALADRLSSPDCRVHVTIDRHAAAGPLPALVDHAGYRLAQEALTNAVRHAAATRVDVRIRQHLDTVTIIVEDDGQGRPPSSRPLAGSGLRGMRERAHLLGGRLDIGPRPPHGWRVEAVLPTHSGG
ncbi:sensor histidine kinase [Nonomuraea jabiensis]|uniref:sensor histidine kinase n=1 Tax=Nonomuraea jabiensis TaxID=882448 RepID=UPI003684357E